MADVAQCEELTTSGGAPLSCAKAWGEGCRCGACVQWKTYGEEPADDSGTYDPADKPRREDGRFQSTALTRSIRGAVEEVGGEETLYGYVEAGMSARQICGALGLERTGDAAQGAIYRLLHSNPERYDKARRISATAHAEKAGEVFGDEAPDGLTSAEAKYMADKSGWHRWMAEMRSGRSHGDVNINVDLGQLHLSALRAKGSMDAVREREPVEADYEIEQDD